MTTTSQSKPFGPVAALLLAATLCGCSSVVDHIPTSVGGLPEGVPQRPATQADYPAVHDIPPARQDSALSEAESKRLREDLKNTRNRVAPTEE
jgi:type IV pilus biogenesis protein CpaD/CtpE